ncbi:MAG TPA: nicotinate-nucleotide diphosphorylase (carboxylating), partial [Polyangiaceae bacterium]
MLSLSFEAIVDLALQEDLAAGDVTTESCIAADAKAVAHAVARKRMVVCGGPVFARVFEKIDPRVAFEAHVEEGARVEPGARLWTVRGSARSILMGERTALNFVQRMCGIATMAHTYVSALSPGSRTRIIDTRKTTPGLRRLEKQAVLDGGGHNHRIGLFDFVLIKE